MYNVRARTSVASEIPISRVEAPEIYSFADYFVGMRDYVSPQEYMMLIRWEFPRALMSVLSDPGMCEKVFDYYFGEPCMVDPIELEREFLSVLSKPEVVRIARENGVRQWSVRFRDDRAVIGGRVLVEPWIIPEKDGYRIYLSVRPVQQA